MRSATPVPSLCWSQSPFDTFGRASPPNMGLLWSGALLQGFSIGLFYWAVYHGLPAGIAALIGGLQPAIVAVLGVFGDWVRCSVACNVDRDRDRPWRRRVGGEP